MTPRPYGLLAELTHACPLRCPYCSNPLELAKRSEELPVAVWERVMAEAAELGVLQVGCSGGEPLLYHGLESVIRRIRSEGMYSNLITSGIGLTLERALRLAEAGLDAVQVSFQSDERETGDQIAGARAHDAKLAACEAIHHAKLTLGINVVLHRRNVSNLREIIHLAERVGAMRLELANVQFAGWAWPNRMALLPLRDQVIEADRIAEEESARLRDRMQIVYVMPDFYGSRPKPCLHGWAQRGITVNPRGDVLPCQAAEAISELRFENVRDHSLREIWSDSDAFNRFRGTDWMLDPCRSCPEREVDFGGCRCQAALLTGDARRADPVCALSPDRPLVDAILRRMETEPADSTWTYRSASTSASLTGAPPLENSARM